MMTGLQGMPLTVPYYHSPRYFIVGAAGQTFMATGVKVGVDFFHSDTGVSVDLRLSDRQTGEGFAAGATLTGIREVFGSQFDDTITGDEHGNVIDGGSGDDRIFGGGGNDILHGNGGNNILDGGDGDDMLVSDAGNDRLSGGNGNDIMGSGDGDDILEGGDGAANRLEGGAGADILTGRDGADVFVVSDVAASLATSDRITDVEFGGTRDSINLGPAPRVWVRRFDVDGDGDLDTGLYDSAAGDGGIYAILLDYSGALTRDDFEGVMEVSIL